MRPFSIIGWFMCQAIGTMQLDRDASQLRLMARAWAADVEHAGRRTGMSDGTHPSLRRMYERPDPNDTLAVLRHVKEIVDRAVADVGDGWLSKPLWGSRAGGKTDWDRRSGFPEKVEPMAVCPQCGDACPKSKVDDLHGVCDKCYWENEL